MCVSHCRIPRVKRWFTLVALLLALFAPGTAGAGPINLLQNGGFEGYTTAQVPSCGVAGGSFGPSSWWCSSSTAAVNGNLAWGRADFRWSGGWVTKDFSSWTYLSGTVGSWRGGAVNRSQDFGAGWKYARSGVLFGIIQNRLTLSQTFTFTGTQTSLGALDWYDAGRPSWELNTFFGDPNDYSVTLTDNLNNTQTIGSYTSVAANSTGAWNGIWTEESLKAWTPRTQQNTFTLEPGRTYTLNFNSLAPFQPDGVNIQDRATFLDDIFLSASALEIPEPSALLLFGLGAAGLAGLRRRSARRRA
jgi:hypothetical protein